MMKSEEQSDTGPEQSQIDGPTPQYTKPCCCYEMEYETYYKCFTLVCFVGIVVNIINSFILFAITFLSFISLFFNLILMAFLGMGYYKYKKTRNYGNSMSYCFALTLHTCAWISLVFAAIAFVAIAIFGTVIFERIGFASYTSFRGSILAGIALVLLPFNVFWLYWTYCYLSVIKEGRTEHLHAEEMRSGEESGEVSEVLEDSEQLSQGLTDHANAASAS